MYLKKLRSKRDFSRLSMHVHLHRTRVGTGKSKNPQQQTTGPKRVIADSDKSFLVCSSDDMRFSIAIPASCLGVLLLMLKSNGTTFISYDSCADLYIVFSVLIIGLLLLLITLMYSLCTLLKTENPGYYIKDLYKHLCHVFNIFCIAYVIAIAASGILALKLNWSPLSLYLTRILSVSSVIALLPVLPPMFYWCHKY
jgi:hypothetical protein